MRHLDATRSAEVPRPPLARCGRCCSRRRTARSPPARRADRRDRSRCPARHADHAARPHELRERTRDSGRRCRSSGTSRCSRSRRSTRARTAARALPLRSGTRGRSRRLRRCAARLSDGSIQRSAANTCTPCSRARKIDVIAVPHPRSSTRMPGFEREHLGERVDEPERVRAHRVEVRPRRVVRRRPRVVVVLHVARRTRPGRPGPSLGLR